ncbi:unnamed protein product, partial [Urochloa humidicola]
GRRRRRRRRWLASRVPPPPQPLAILQPSGGRIGVVFPYSPARYSASPPPRPDMTTGSSKKSELKSKQKLEKKLSFYSKVKDAVTSLNAKKTISKKKNQSRRQKKLKAYDLSALSEFLPEPAAPEQKAEAKLNCKSRQTLVLREAAHLKAVLNNPQFQLDPFAAIHQHLLATQPPTAAKDNGAKHGKDSKDKKRRRKKKSASSSSQAMDI